MNTDLLFRRCFCVVVWAFLHRHRKGRRAPWRKELISRPWLSLLRLQIRPLTPLRAQRAHTWAQKHNLVGFTDWDKVLLPVAAYFSSPATVLDCAKLFSVLLALFIWFMHDLLACWHVRFYVCALVVCVHVCSHFSSFVLFLHQFGLFTQLGKQIACYLDRDVE